MKNRKNLGAVYIYIYTDSFTRKEVMINVIA